MIGRQPSDFNQQVERIEKTVSVDFFNELSVKPGGKPGSLINLSIIANGDISAPAPTASIDAQPAAIDAGETATLSWHATDAVLIEPGIGPVVANDTATVTPAATTTYTITATGAGGTATASATVTVIQSKPTVSIVAEPTALTVGESATLSWSSTDAYGCEIDNGIGAVPPAGSITVSPGQTTTYTITVTGPGGTASANVLVTVSQPQSPIGLSFDDLNGAPLEGAIVHASRISIGGGVASAASSEVGVRVNGVLAQVAGSRFVANHVPLAPGWSTITAEATDGDGNKAPVGFFVEWDAGLHGNHYWLTTDSEIIGQNPDNGTVVNEVLNGRLVKENIRYAGSKDVRVNQTYIGEAYQIASDQYCIDEWGMYCVPNDFGVAFPVPITPCTRIRVKIDEMSTTEGPGNPDCGQPGSSRDSF